MAKNHIPRGEAADSLPPDELQTRHAEIEADSRERGREADRQRGRGVVLVSNTGGQDPPQLVAEGDSWFDYSILGTRWILGFDVLDYLKDRHAYPIKQLSRKGDTLENMVYGTTVAANVRLPSPLLELVAAVKEYQPRAVLFSGGGNDVADVAPLTALLNHRGSCSDDRLLRKASLDEVIHSARVAYVRAATEVRRAKDDVLFITHGYGRPYPTGLGAHFVLNCLPTQYGPWLLPAFLAKGITDAGVQREIIWEVIDQFNFMLKEVADELGEWFVYIDLRKLITEKDWVNELHLKNSAFERVAEEFHKTLCEKLKWNAPGPRFPNIPEPRYQSDTPPSESP